MRDRIALTGIGLVSPAASSLESFARVRGAEADGAPVGGRMLPLLDFDPARYLGERGFKYLTPATQYALAAARLALEDAGVGDYYQGDERGVVLGTNFAVWSVLADMDATILRTGADQIRPMEAANFSVNIPASQLSIRYGLHAFNVTLTTARIAGLEAVALGAECLRRGRARMVLAGALEGRAPEALQGYFSPPIAEGAACLMVLEPLSAALERGARVHGEIGPSLFRFWPAVLEGVSAPAESGWSEGMLADLVGPGLDPVHLFEAGHGCPRCERLAQIVDAAASSAGRRVERHVLSDRFGECSTVSPMMQVLDFCLSGLDAGLVVAASPQGHAALSGWLRAAA